MNDLTTLLWLGWLLQLFWWVFPILGLVWWIIAIRRAAGSRSVQQLLRSIEQTQRALDGLPGASQAERRAQQAMILQMLSGISNQYGAMNSHARSDYSPTIASLHSMAAQNGIDWTPPNY
jgi:hypothetical protein